MGGWNTPRATRLTPIITPIGIAVRQASAKAPNTRPRLVVVCCSSVAPAKPSVATWMNWPNTACGVGRKIGLTSPELLTTTHSSSNTATVADAITVELPCPGAPKCSPGLAARLANRRVKKRGTACTAGAWIATAESLDMADLLVGAGGALVAVDDAEHELAHADELGARFHGARVARLEEPLVEVELVAVGDAAGPRRHHDQVRCEEQGLLHAVGDEEEHLLRLQPHLQQQLLDGLARQRVERRHRLVHPSPSPG